MGLHSASTFRHKEPSAKDVGLFAEDVAGRNKNSCSSLEKRMLRRDFFTPYNYLEGDCGKVGEVGQVGQAFLPGK